MAITRNFIEFTKTWLSIGDKEDDVFSGDGKVEGGPSDGEWHTKDEMRGGGGDDYFDGDFGTNIMFGERGADTFEIGNSGSGGSWDRAYGGDGRDRFLAYEYSPMEGKLHLANGGHGHDTLRVLSYLTTGEDGPAVLRNEKIILNGKAILKLKSVEEVIGNVENDSLRASGAIRHLDGGKGDDTLAANPNKNSTLIGGYGDDTLRGGNMHDQLFDQEDVRRAKPEYIDPDADKLIGGKGHDFLLSYAGDDKLFGGEGGDAIVSLAGTDVIRGGAGSDTISFAFPVNYDGESYRPEYLHRIISTLDGMYIDGGTDGTVGDFVDFSGIEAGYGALTDLGLVINLASGRGKEYTSPEGPGHFRIKDVEHVRGTSLADKLIGSGDGNSLRGGAGDDELRGGAGSDSLFGGTGRNILFGGEGNDLLNVSGDGDILTGGAGKDRFIFDAGFDSTATITDFQVGIDKIVLWSLDFEALTLSDVDKGVLVTAKDSSIEILLTGLFLDDVTETDFASYF